MHKCFHRLHTLCLFTQYSLGPCVDSQTSMRQRRALVTQRSCSLSAGMDSALTPLCSAMRWRIVCLGKTSQCNYAVSENNIKGWQVSPKGTYFMKNMRFVALSLRMNCYFWKIYKNDVVFFLLLSLCFTTYFGQYLKRCLADISLIHVRCL